MAGGIKQGDQPQKAKERPPEQIGLILGRAEQRALLRRIMIAETISTNEFRMKICSIVGISRLSRTTTCMDAKHNADKII